MRIVLIFLCVTIGAFGASRPDQPALERAQDLYRHTDYLGVLDLLQPAAAESAAASALVGKSFLMVGEYGKATEYLEKAIALEPGNSKYHLWLGRAYGRRAEVAFPVAAPRYASKARTNFEKALELDPQDSEITGDLFEYYLQAPGILGGGFDKAARLADKIAQRDPVEGNFAKARLAEERKDFGTAEILLRRAVELAPRQPGRLVDLAKFLAKRGRFDESDAAFSKARQFAPEAPRVLFHEAATYIKENRKQNEARELLKRYLSASVGPEDPSKQDAQKLLKKVSGS